MTSRGAAPGRALSRPESALARWGRRAITVPAYLALALVAVALLPVTVPLAALVDLARRAPWPLARTVLVVTWYLACEALGLVASAGLWLVGQVAPERAAHWNFRLQCLWARALFAGARAAFGLRLEVAGAEAIGSGPLILLMRHASVADTLLPAVLVSSGTGLRLRYVMKRELLWDPCLDVVGQRLRNAFVRRGTGDRAETALVRDLALDLGPDEGVLLYPEGTRFTPARRRRVLERLAATADPKRLEQARALQWLLPPRLGGVLALLEAAPGTDVLLCVHTGFEGVRSLADVWNGALVGRRVRVEFRRVPASAIPTGPEARADWIYEEWARLDAWLQVRLDEPGPGAHA